MTPEQQRIAIAEFCGWTSIMNHPVGLVGFHPQAEGESLGFCQDKTIYLIPDYPNDLNAMHEAEKTLPELQRQLYYSELIRVLIKSINSYNFYDILTATSQQRSEALLKTIGKWI